MPDARYSVELSPAAKRDLKKLPRVVQQEIVFTHLPAIQTDPFLTSSPLVGALHGEHAYHFGRKPEYRIIFYLESKNIVVTIIGTRENLYRKAQRRKKGK